MCKEHNMIEPFLDYQVSEGKISYGLSSMGYDVRISDEFRIFTNVNTSLVDPKNFSEDNFVFIRYALTKTIVFAFIITSISSYYGYYLKGGALEVGKASTNAVVYSSIFILFANYILTQLMLI